MKVSVTPYCRHRDPQTGDLTYHSSGEPITGRRLLVTPDGVWVDGRPAVLRDRRAKAVREPGHPWNTSNEHPDPAYRRIPWTSFTIDVEP